ncbi:MAG TPA: threonine synthase, partial [Hyphomicrobiales bacterium]|nr:threonine synthase [Hyphomicrobiales bacterium]
MNYISTRGNSPSVGFEQAVLTGLAPDGGLYIPQTLPQVSPEQLRAWAALSYQELAFEVIKPFVAGAVPDAELKAMIDASYADFSDPRIAPLVHLYDNQYVLELYCGPTLAFKDFALQLLGRLLDYFLSRRGQ